MGIPILSGRGFTAADIDGRRSGHADLAVGREGGLRQRQPARRAGADRQREQGTWRTIVGVVADVHHDDLTAPLAPAMYVAQAQFTDSYLVAVVKAGTADAATLAAPARAVLRELDSSVPVYQVATLPSLVEKAAAERLFVMRLLAGFALVAVLLAAIGLYGVVSYGVAQRTREVGVRVALGAQRRDVLRLVLSSGLSLVGAGIAIGLVAAVAATRFLGALVFGVSPMDPPTFAAAAALLTLVALGAHWVPVRRALRIDPAQRPESRVDPDSA